MLNRLAAIFMGRFFLVLSFLLASFLMLYSAYAQSFWLDEATTAKVVYKFSFFQIIPEFSVADFHPPLYYLLVDLWQKIFPLTEFFLRLPSIIFILLSFLVIIRSCGRVWAGVFLLFNPLILYYAVEARMYALVVFLFTLSLCRFLQGRFDKVFYAALFLSLLSFYGSVFFVLSYLFYFLVKRRWRQVKYLLFLLGGFFLVIAPLFLRQIQYSAEVLASVPNWSQALGKANLKNLFLVFVKMILGRVRFEDDLNYYLSIGVGFLLVYVPAILLDKDEKVKRLTLMFVFPIFLGFLFSFYRPVLQYFRFLYAAVVLSLLLSYISSLRYKIFLFLIFFLPLSFLTAFDKTYYREDWRSAISELGKGERVYMIKEVSDPVWYYDLVFSKNLQIEDVRDLPRQKPKKAIVIQYAAGIFALDFQSLMSDYKILDKKVYPGNIIVYRLSL